MKRLAPLLLVVALAPALFFTVTEFASLTESERLLDDAHRRQLDAILFSINQYAWDVSGGWMGAAARLHADSTDIEARSILERSAVVRAVLVIHEQGPFRVQWASARGNTEPEWPGLTDSLERRSGLRQRLERLSSPGYRATDAIPLGRGDDALCLLFLADDRSTLLALLVDVRSFISDVLGRKLTDIAGNEFILTVRRDTAVAYTTGGGAGAAAREHSQALWLLPRHRLGIGSPGTSIEEVVRTRFLWNAGLLVALDLALLVIALLTWRAYRREAQLAALKDEFVSNVSHELKTPLSLIRMFAETLEMNRVVDEEKKQEYYRIMLHESERLTRLIDRVLTFSRMESGTARYRFERHDLAAIIRDVLGTYEQQFHRGGHEVTLHLQEEIPPLRIDREAVTEAILNLLDNAMKHGGEGTRIDIACTVTASAVLLGISDNGPGIPADSRERIFEKFTRLPRPDGSTVKGTGLGLALVRGILRTHGGDATVHDAPGGGSTFRLRFPVDRDDAPAKE